MPGMGGRVKCRVLGVRGVRFSRCLQRCLLKIIRKVVKKTSLPHTLVLVVKNRRSRTSRPRQDEEAMQMSPPLDEYTLEPTVRRAFQLQTPCSSSEEPPAFQQIDLIGNMLLEACLGSEDALISSSRNCRPDTQGAEDPAFLNKHN